WVIPSESVSERSSPAPYRSHGGAGPVSGWIGAVPVSCSWTSKRLSRSAPPAVSDPDDAADPDVGPHPAGSVAVGSCGAESDAAGAERRSVGSACKAGSVVPGSVLAVLE